MSRKRKTGEVIAYLLPVVAGTLLILVIAPVIMWMNTREYADEHSRVLGIQSWNASVSALAAFACVVVFGISLHRIALDDGTVLDSPLSRVYGDGLMAGSAIEPTPTEVLTLLPVGEENKDTDLNNETQNHE